MATHTDQLTDLLAQFKESAMAPEEMGQLLRGLVRLQPVLLTGEPDKSAIKTRRKAKPRASSAKDDSPDTAPIPGLLDQDQT